MIRIPKGVLEETANYRYQVEGRLKGTVPAEVFKPYQAQMGIYEQRQDGQYMVRGVIPSGNITLEQFLFVKELAKAFANGCLHFTTRQDIQFHGVTLENTVYILEKLSEIGITTKGAGGSTVRNIALSPLSGVSCDEVFDPTLYAHATTEYCLKDPSAFKLPRKYKISFSNSKADTAGATLSDLGFIATDKDGIAGFKVYGAGGLGGSAAPAILLEEFAGSADILYYVEAMKRLFEREGDRTNRNKARIRFILKRLGEEAFKSLFNGILDEVKSELSLKLDLPAALNPIVDEAQIKSEDARIYKQRQGNYSVYVHPRGGNIGVADIEPLLNKLRSLEEPVSIRLTTSQGFVIRDVMKADLPKVIDLVDAYTSPYALDHSIACTGASTCRLGILDTSVLLDAIIKRFEHEEVSIRNALPRLFISGCPNSCGQHQKAAIGFTGKMKNSASGKLAFYTLSIGGHVEAGATCFGEPFKDIPEHNIPEFLYDAAILIKETEKTLSNDNSIDQFIKNNKKMIWELAEKWSNPEGN